MRVTHLHGFNFRSIDDLTLDLSNDGLTALVGPPGSGKSSLFSLIPFVLYGDTGQNGSLTDLRRRGSDPKALCGGTVTLTHGQDTIVASRWLTRTMPRGKVKETGHATLTVNGNTVEGMTPTRLTEEITALIGMPRDAFRGANFIGQGEVDVLATATPSEVQKLVEHHTGLASLTKERQRQREAARDAVSAANALPGALDDVERTAEARDEAQEAVDVASAAAVNARKRAEHIRSTLDDAKVHARALQDAERAAQASRDAAVGARAVARQERSRVESLTAELASRGVDPDLDLQSLRKDRERLDSLSAALVDAGSSYAHLRESAARTEQAAQAAAREVQSIDREALASRRAEAVAEQDRADNEGRAAAELRAGRQAEVDRLTKALAQFDQAQPGQGCCPTCQQQVADVDVLVRSFQEARAAAQAEIDRAVAAQRTAHAAHQKASSVLAEIERLDRDADAALREAQRTRADLDTLTGTLGKGAAQLRAAMQALGAAVADDLEGEKLLVAARQAGQDARANMAEIDARGQAVSAVVSARKSAEQAESHATEAEANIGSAPDPETIAAAVGEVDRLQAAYDDSAEAASTAASDLNAANVTLAKASSDADVEAQRWEAKQKALTNSEIATGTANVIEALRSELLTEYTGQISSAASELLARFGGEHVGFQLGADFVPRVQLVDGTLVETRTLSGGEKARAGLAFRLGITLQITRGGVPDQVLGDEVTNYLDEEGRRAVVSALQELFPSVLLISHTAEALDLASQVVSLARQPLGSTEQVGDGMELAAAS